MITSDAFLAIEKALTQRLLKALSRITGEIYPKVDAALASGDLTRAHELLASMSLASIRDEEFDQILFLTNAAMLFGASRVTQQPGTSVVGMGFEAITANQMASHFLQMICQKAESYLFMAGSAFIFPPVKKGESKGHPFRGNQYTDGFSGPLVDLDKLPPRTPAKYKAMAPFREALYGLHSSHSPGVRNYIDNGSFKVNSGLLGVGVGHVPFSKDLVEPALATEKALEASSLPSNIVLHRQVRDGQQSLGGITAENAADFVGKTFSSKTPVPTSATSNSGDEYKGSLSFEIHAHKGTHGLYLGPYQEEAHNADELVLAPSTLYTVKSTVTTSEGTHVVLIAKPPKAKKAEGDSGGAGRVLHPFSSFMDSAGKSYFNIASSLHTSRVSAYGFTAEAKALGLTEYQLSEQLDKRTCPVCQLMHGKKFKVDDARKLLQVVTRAVDPDDLKALQPWPKQDAKNLEAMAAMSADELVAKGWHTPPFHPRPVSEDTEFLSDSGWKLVKDAVVGERAFSLNPSTGCVEWVPVVGVVHAGKAPHGRMVHFHSQNADLLVTEDHDQTNIRSVNGVASLVSSPAGDLLSLSKATLPRAGYWVGSPCSLSPALVQLTALWISDGSCVRKGPDSYEISISTRKYQDLASSLLSEVTGKPVRKKDSRVECNDTTLGSYLLGVVGSGCRGKSVPPAIMEADKDTIQLFLNTYLVADGSVCTAQGVYGESLNKTFFTTSEVLAAQLGELIVKAGGFPSYSWQDNSLNPQFIGDREIVSSSPIIRIRWCKSHTATFGKYGKGTMGFVPYQGLTYCLTLERNHIFYVRRNGKCIWTGNCRGLLTRVGKVPSLESVASGTFQEKYVTTKADFDFLGSPVSAPGVKLWNKVSQVSPTEVVARLSGAPVDEFLAEMIGAEDPKKQAGLVSLSVGRNVSVSLSKPVFGSQSPVDQTVKVLPSGNVVLEKLMLHDEPEGAKVFKSYMRELYALSKDMGAKNLEVHASGASWARFGFKPSMKQWDLLKADIQDRYVSLGFGESQSALQAKAYQAVMASNDPACIYTLSDLPFGSALLDGLSWAGALDMADEEAVVRFLTFLGDL